MTEAELRERLRAVAPPEGDAAQERAWRMVRAALADARRADALPAVRPSPRSRLRPRLIIPALTGLLVLAALALAATRPAHVTLGRWLRDAIGLSPQPRPRPLLAGLPGGGQLLVDAPAGIWIVESDGTRRFLGRYTAAAWSPHTLYVVAWQGRRLTVLDPHGARQWSLSGAAAISAARWSPDGYRIAYLSGDALWVVAGDGSGGHRLPGTVASVAPAWQPRTGASHRLAVVTARGALQLRDADAGTVLWSVRPATAPRRLLWSSDGRRLIVVGTRRVAVYDDRGRAIGATSLPGGARVAGAAGAPTGDRVALALSRPHAGALAVLQATSAGLRRAPRILFSAAARIDTLSWSPDGRWLLASVPAADQWIFVGTGSPPRLAAVSHIGADFRAGAAAASAFPALGGWQLRAAGTAVH